ncbi:MAG: TIGR00282 family metallophosphoesterase [Nitrospirae bacterium CG02_land_8_20_14_3_00_44_33]|nr:TIGR00282 family metallophosphoesterase [Nitrospirota bacterium]PIV41256.1 MAG: TIGR00282 family metallophosphoesterase [Nitrospirae bacterium CG02_land_8_20_14_3_00_44_33]
MKVLFIGDIVGKLGRTTLKGLLPNIVDRYKIDFVIVNGENAAGGFGVTEKTAAEILNCGVNIITTGNHIWDKKDSIPYIAKEDRILRPVNYPPGVPGCGSAVQTLSNGTKVGVLNISGRVFMSALDCPFRTGKEAIKKLRESTDIIIVDFHAEATSEKIAFGYFVDGEVSAVIGTHTHVQTADEKILPNSTAYITDVGMTGPAVSIIGIEKEQIIERFLLQMPMRFEVAKGEGILCAVVIEIDEKTGKAAAIQRLQLKYP